MKEWLRRLFARLIFGDLYEDWRREYYKERKP